MAGEKSGTGRRGFIKIALSAGAAMPVYGVWSALLPESREVILENAKEVREKSPSAYGVYNLVYNGILVGDQYMNKAGVLEKVHSIDGMVN